MSALIPPHRQYRTPHITRADIEYHLDRAEVRRLVGDDKIAAVAARVGMTPEEALVYLMHAPRWVLEPEGS
ncbi:hypothetical protein ACFC34_00600 [Streptomyces sp. NPDC056053]|uniref:hypothetical protein n=1 Tax=Streptomyces sp. NPDC056053 TaxID=3345696 RepID=UPI0035DDFCEA